jgi:hypothetical protein
MKLKKIGHIGFKKKNVFRFVKKLRKKVEREKKVFFFRSGICTVRYKSWTE